MTRFAPTLGLAALSAALGLSACDDQRQARIDAPEPEPLAYLAAAAELPYAEPAPVDWQPPQQGYRWAERAYGLQRAFYDVPPDYGFEYGGIEPLVWESEDDWDLYAEPWDDGYRYYYYEPGAAYPYFVLDRDYGYGFGPTGILVAVFDIHGAYLPRDVVYRVAPVAGRYYLRGRDLRNAGLQSRRIAVTDRYWTEAAPRVTRSSDRWMRAARDDRAWRQWRERDGDRELRRFEGEQRRREDRRVAAVRPQAFPPTARAPREQRQDERLALRESRQAQFERRAAEDRGRPMTHEAQHGREQAQAERSQRAAVEQRQAMAPAERGRRQADAQRQERVAAQAEAEHGRQQAEARRQERAAAERQQGFGRVRADRQQAEAQAAREQRQAQAHAQQQARAEQQARAQEREAHQARAQQQARAEQQAQARSAQQQARAAANREQAGRAQAQQARAAEQQARAAAAHERGAAQAKAQTTDDNPHGRRHGRKEE